MNYSNVIKVLTASTLMFLVVKVFDVLETGKDFLTVAAMKMEK
jgi:hypothetical protein